MNIPLFCAADKLDTRPVLTTCAWTVECPGAEDYAEGPLASGEPALCFAEAQPSATDCAL